MRSEESREERRKQWRIRRRYTGKRGFRLLTGVNIAVALLSLALAPLGGFVILLGFPVVHLIWSLPMILHAEARRLEDYASGLKVAAGLASLAGCACWGIVCVSL
ncbi:MAG: hypothetical protein ABL998_22495 [Planctomycetota bacterium]